MRSFMLAAALVLTCVFATNAAVIMGSGTFVFRPRVVTPDPPPTTCTDGVDCRCDVLVATYGDDIAFCEDFENPGLKSDWSFGSFGWDDQGYGPLNRWCFGYEGGDPVADGANQPADVTNNNGCIYLLDRNDASTQPGAGPSETQIPLADQTFDGNTTLMQTVRPGDPSVTLTANDGQDYMLRQSGGFHGLAFLSKPVTDFGITTARYIAVGVPNQGPAWKGNQYTPAKAALLGTWNTAPPLSFSTGLGTNSEPYTGSLWKSDLPMVYTNAEGQSFLTTSATPVLKSAPDDPQSPLFPRGQWVCQQVQYEGWGTSTNGRIRHWVDGQLVIDVQGLDMSDAYTNPGNPDNSWSDTASPGGAPGLYRFYWNNYYNGSPPGGNANWAGVTSNANAGPDTLVWSGRLQDNLVIKEGAPVSCAEIGF